MTERARKRAVRGYAASRFDEVTLALFVVLLIMAAGAVMQLGVNEALDRVGCGLNDAVDGLLAYPRACR